MICEWCGKSFPTRKGRFCGGCMPTRKKRLAVASGLVGGEPVRECGTSDAEIYERIDMAETYPGSGVLNFGEVWLRTITDWCDLVRGTDYDCEKCDIESIMQTMQKWWRDKTPRAGGEKGGV